MNADAVLRKRVYALVIAVTAGCVGGRIVGVELVYEPSLHRNLEETAPGKREWPKKKPLPMPTFSSNDRSRWATVRSLVEDGAYVVGQRDRTAVMASAVSLVGAHDGAQAAILTASGYWVRTKKSDSGLVTEDGWLTVDKVLKPDTLKFYSSKPPLLSTLVAGLYWVLFQLGLTFANNPWAVVSVILLLVNWLPFLIYLGLLARLLERYGSSDWGRLYVFVAAAFATLATTFAITFNNHSVATYGALFALYSATRIWEERGGPVRWFVLAGFFAGFTACNELPAAAFAVFLGLALLWRAPVRTLGFFVPAAVVPLAAFLLTNYLAIGQFRPAYDEFGSPWYEYEGSHWRKAVAGESRSGIDWARLKETRAEYAFHVLVGHHGLLTLSPIWLLALAGMLAFPLRLWPTGETRTPPGERSGLNLVMTLTVLLTVVVVGFYLLKSDNYGGWTAGLRWLMWLSPFWLLTMLPVADRLSSWRGGRVVGYVLLAISVFSVAYNLRNPWRHPWLYDFMQAQGWIAY